MKDLNGGNHQNPKEKTGGKLFDLGCTNFLLDISPKARETQAKISYWDYIKIKKKVLHSKGNSPQN